jgi:YgiT-type zinc finger domain-containing protein
MRENEAGTITCHNGVHSNDAQVDGSRNKEQEMKNQYAYGDCQYCGGRVTEQLVQKVCTWGGRLIGVVDNVPAGVCNQCGERYFRARVLKEVESMLGKRAQISKHIRIPFYTLKAS